MKISLNWLADYIDLKGIPVDQIISTLNMSGLEVEDVINERKNAADIINQDAADRVAEAQKKAAEDAKKAREKEFEQRLSSIKGLEAQEKAIAATKAKDTEELEKEIQRITDDSLGKQLLLYNEFSKDTKDIIEGIGNANIKQSKETLDQIEREKKEREEKNKGLLEDEITFNELVLEAENDAADQSFIYFEEIEEKKRKIRDQILSESFQLSKQILDSIFQLQTDDLRRRQDRESDALSEEKDRALSNKRLTEGQKEKINKEFAAKEQVH